LGNNYLPWKMVIIQLAHPLVEVTRNFNEQLDTRMARAALTPDSKERKSFHF